MNNRLLQLHNSDLAETAHQLIEQQLSSWQQCADGYATLNSVLVKKFEFDGFNINVQFNPGRLISSSAKVDPKSISERKCFLCMENLPPDQKGISYREHYIILCNPFPIFPEHFTIPSIEHRPQVIYSSFCDFLHITKDIGSKYLVFYNGPKCGASAPDHFHFQAGTKEFLPLITGYEYLKHNFGHIIFSGRYEVSHLEDGLRKFIVIEGDCAADLVEVFDIIYKELEKISPPGEEPLMNIISSYEEGAWKILIILREKHRPARFFSEGDDKLLLSPAAVDIGGVCITPVENDFNKITRDDLIGIFNEVILSSERYSLLIENLRGAF